MARGDAEYAALRDALKASPPPCDADNRFVMDNPSPSDLRAMSGICETCPIRVECAAYAAIAKPPGSYWAGKHYPPDGERKPRVIREEVESA